MQPGDLSTSTTTLARDAVQLTAAERETVRQAVHRAVGPANVYIFGSRATGKARPFSDLDLLFVEPARLTLKQRAALVDLLEASTLPFRVDLVEAAGLPDGMRERVLAERVAL
jgi:uncharacterized protein